MGNEVRTMADIARLAGVSVSTVSRALNDSPLIPEETKERIRRIARTYNYELHVGARNLRLQRTQTIAAVIPFGETSDRQVSDPFYLEIIGAIANKLAEYDYDLLISRAHAADEGWYQRYVLGKRVDGLIIIGRKLNDRGIAKLVELGANFVVWGPPLPGQRYVSVGSDGVSGAAQAVRHLIQLGRRRIAFIGGDEDETETWLRRRGYEQELQRAGLPLDANLIAYAHFTSESGYFAMRQLLARAPDIDGVFVCSDLMAVAAMEALRQEGRDVPNDVSIVGYDDIPLAAHCSPPLTTVRQQIRRGGMLLASKLIDLIEGRQVESVTLPVELIIRESCGAKVRSARGC